MILVNETRQPVDYWISADGGSPNCGSIEAEGIADLPQYDDQTNVYVGFKPSLPNKAFIITCAHTGTGEQVEIALIAAGGK